MKKHKAIGKGEYQESLVSRYRTKNPGLDLELHILAKGLSKTDAKKMEQKEIKKLANPINRAHANRPKRKYKPKCKPKRKIVSRCHMSVQMEMTPENRKLVQEELNFLAQSAQKTPDEAMADMVIEWAKWRRRNR